MSSFNFETLNAYKYARALVKSVYILIRKLPREEQYHFVEISYGSLMEVLCQLTLANDLEYITEEELLNERQQIEDLAKILSGLRSSIDKRLNGNTQH